MISGKLLSLKIERWMRVLSKRESRNIEIDLKRIVNTEIAKKLFLSVVRLKRIAKILLQIRREQYVGLSIRFQEQLIE